MTDTFIAINGHRVVSAVLTVGNGGAWFMDCDLEEDPSISGLVEVRIDQTIFKGTIYLNKTGRFGLQTRCRVIAGGNGWSSEVPAKDYHNDNGVKAKTVAEDAARAVGETIGFFQPQSEKLGIDYVRSAGVAARVMNDVLGGAIWWVDYNGVTNAGPRPAINTDSKAYQLVNYNPRERIATLKIYSVDAIQVGSTLVVDLDEPQVVRSFELSINAGGMQVTAWCGGNDRSIDRLAGLFRSVARQAVQERLFGIYKYRVVKMSVDRVEMQVVRKSTGLPDLLPVSVWPGVAGVHAVLAPSAEVLVQFIDGDRTQPIVTHFAGKDGIGFVPISLVLGGPTGPAAARQGDNVEVLLPPAMFTGTIGGSPASGVINFLLPKALGVITSGSGKVKIAT